MKPNEVKQRLEEYFTQTSPADKNAAAVQVEVVDLTGTENHYEVTVESKAFLGLSRVQQHQKVMAAFALELKTGEVHALSIRTKVSNA